MLKKGIFSGRGLSGDLIQRVPGGFLLQILYGYLIYYYRPLSIIQKVLAVVDGKINYSVNRSWFSRRCTKVRRSFSRWFDDDVKSNSLPYGVVFNRNDIICLQSGEISFLSIGLFSRLASVICGRFIPQHFQIADDRLVSCIPCAYFLTREFRSAILLVPLTVS